MAATNLLATGTTPPGTLGGAQTQGANPLATGYNPNTTDPGGYVFGIGDQPALDTSKIGTGDDYMKQMQEAYYKQGAARLDPRFSQQQETLDTRLANQGLNYGSEAWKAAQQAMSFERNDAYSSLSNQAILNSGTEAQRIQAMNLASQTAQNTALGQQFGQNISQAELSNAGYGALQGNVLTREGYRSNEQIARDNAAAQAAIAAAQTASAERIAASNAASAKDIAGMNIGFGREQMAQAASQFGQSYALQSKAQQAQMDQAAATLGMSGKQLDAQVAQYAEQNGISRQAAADAVMLAQAQMAQSKSQFESSQGLTREQMAQSGKQFESTQGLTREQMAQSGAQFTAAQAQSAAQFGQTLAESQAGRLQSGQQFTAAQAQQAAQFTAAAQQSASQFNKSYELQTAAQKAQMDQFAQTFGLSGRQLDAQIAQYAEQNGIARETIANQLAIAAGNNATQLAAANIGAGATAAASQAQAGATLGAAQIGANTAAAAQAEQRRQYDANAALQAPFWQLAYQNALAQGMSPASATQAANSTPATPATGKGAAPAY